MRVVGDRRSSSITAQQSTMYSAGRTGTRRARYGRGSVGPLAAEDEQPDRREGVEEQRGEDHVVEQLPVRAREAEDRRPDRLHDQREGGDVVARSTSPPCGRRGHRAPSRSSTRAPDRINPLLQPKVEMRIAPAMSTRAARPEDRLGHRGADAILRRVAGCRAPRRSRPRRRRRTAAR